MFSALWPCSKKHWQAENGKDVDDKWTHCVFVFRLFWYMYQKNYCCITCMEQQLNCRFTLALGCCVARDEKISHSQSKHFALVLFSLWNRKHEKRVEQQSLKINYRLHTPQFCHIKRSFSLLYMHHNVCLAQILHALYSSIRITVRWARATIQVLEHIFLGIFFFLHSRFSNCFIWKWHA